MAATVLLLAIINLPCLCARCGRAPCIDLSIDSRAGYDRKYGDWDTPNSGCEHPEHEITEPLVARVVHLSAAAGKFHSRGDQIPGSRTKGLAPQDRWKASSVTSSSHDVASRRVAVMMRPLLGPVQSRASELPPARSIHR